VKSAILLAALQGSGETLVEEARLSRDHSERLLGAQGATIESVTNTSWRVRGDCPPLAPLDLDVPGDPSSAAYAVALACCLPKSEVVVQGLSLNPTRLGFYALLRRMGANVDWDASGAGPEPRGELTARSSALHGVELGPDDVVSAIDELPLLAVVAAAAEGTTTIRGAGELRHKETDRIAATAALLRAAGVKHEELDDGLVIHGPTQFLAASFDAMGDHRIAMCATVLAALAEGQSELTGGAWVRISYPEFFTDLERLSG
jgi:3-phosphoshikimate 1-carboxyvinyltransferase